MAAKRHPTTATERPGGRVPAGDETGLVGVYATAEAADDVRARALDLGVAPDGVRIGAPADHELSVVGEMREETDAALVVPPVGVSYPKEATRTMGVLGPVIVAVTVLVALPFAAIPFGGLDLWARLLSVAGIGAAMGIAITMVVGPALGVKRPDEPLAADRGVVVRITPATDEVEEMMRAAQPIRLDCYRGPHVEVVATEDLTAGTGVVDEVVRGASDPIQETRPGYPPPDP